MQLTRTGIVFPSPGSHSSHLNQATCICACKILMQIQVAPVRPTRPGGLAPAWVTQTGPTLSLDQPTQRYTFPLPSPTRVFIPFSSHPPMQQPSQCLPSSASPGISMGRPACILAPASLTPKESLGGCKELALWIAL